MKYFSMLRPIGPGGYPKGAVIAIHNYEGRRFCPEINRMAWGYIEYANKLPEEVAYQYGLAPEGRKLWQGVAITVYDDGRTVARIADVIEAEEKPADKSKSLRGKMILKSYFGGREEAVHAVEELNGKMEVGK